MPDPKLEQWCTEARNLLKLAKDTSHDKSIKNLPDYLSKLENDDPQAYAKYKGQFEQILAGMRLLNPPSTKQHRAELKLLGDKLVALKREARTTGKLLTEAQERNAEVTRRLDECAVMLSNLVPSDHPAVLKLQDRLDGARGMLKAMNPDGAEFAVKKFEDLIKVAQTAIDQSRKLEEAHARAKAAASEKRNAIARLVNELEAEFVGQQTLIAELQKALTDTETSAGREEWATVAERLKDVVLPTRDTLIEQSTNAIEAEAKNVPALKRLQTLATTLEQALAASDWAPHKADNLRVLSPFFIAQGKEREQRIKDIEARADVLGQLDTQVKGLATKLPQLGKDLGLIITYLEEKGPKVSTEVTGVIERTRQFDSLVSERCLLSAERLSDGLLAEAQRLQTGIEKNHSAYLTTCGHQPDVITLQRKATELRRRADELGDGPLQTDIRVATALIEPGMLRTLETDGRDWVTLKTRVSRARTDIALLEQRVMDYDKFAGEREEADKKFTPDLQLLDKAIAALRKKLREAGLDVESNVAPFLAERVRLQVAWSERMASATSASELDLAGAQSELGAVTLRALEAATDDGLEKTKTALALAQAKSGFEEEWTLAEKSLEALSAFDMDAAAPLKQKSADIRRQAEGGKDAKAWIDALELLKKQREAADQKKTQLEQQLAQRRLLVTKAYDEAALALTSLPMPLRKRFKQVVEGLAREARELKSMGDSTSEQFIQMALRELPLLKARIEKLGNTPVTPTAKPKSVDEMLADPNNKKSREELQTEFDNALLALQQNATLGSVAKELDAFKLRLKTTTSDFGKDHAVGLKLIRQSLKSLEAELAGMQPAAATAELQQLDASLGLAESLVKTMREERTRLDKALSDLETEVKTLKQAGRALTYVDSVAEQLKGLKGERKNAFEPGAVSSQLRRSEKLLKEVREAKGTEGGLEAQQDKLYQAKLDQDKLEQEWKSRFPSRRAWQAQHMAAPETAILDADGDEGQLKEIRNMRKRAEQQHKDGDLAGALRTLRLAEQRCREVTADPMGPALGARNALMSNAQQYSADARTLAEMIKGLAERAAQRVPTLDPTAKERIGKLAEVAARGIIPDALMGYAAEFETQKDAAVLRDVRERAMAETRSLRSFYTSHPLMRQLALTPLNRAVPNVLVRVQQHLNRFEANVSRSVK